MTDIIRSQHTVKPGMVGSFIVCHHHQPTYTPPYLLLVFGDCCGASRGSILGGGFLMHTTHLLIRDLRSPAFNV